MKLLHTSDLHGSQEKYGKLLKFAIKNKVDIIDLAGDCLPGRDPLIERQGMFCMWLKDWMQQATDEGIHVVYILGNDDLLVMDKVMQDYTKPNPLVHWVDNEAVKIGDFIFTGMSYVKDLPYGLKDRARLDYPNDNPMDILQPPKAFLTEWTDSGEASWKEMPVEKWIQYIKVIPTLYDLLHQLPVIDWEKTVLITHDPPYGIGLDVTNSEEQVGSKAVLDFIELKQPYLTLHGHIHESPLRTGIWNVTVGETLCVQVGQPWSYLNAALINLDTRKVEQVKMQLRR